MATPSVYLAASGKSSQLGQHHNVRNLAVGQLNRPRLNPPHVTTAHQHSVAVCWPRTRVDPHMSAINSSGVCASDGWLGVAAGVLVERHAGRCTTRHDRSAHIGKLRRAGTDLRFLGQHGDLVYAGVEEGADRRKHLGPGRDACLPRVESLLAKSELGGNFRFGHPACVLPVPQHLRQASVLFIGQLGSFPFYHLDKFVTMTYKPRTMPTDLTNLLMEVNGNEEESDVKKYIGYAMMTAPLVALTAAMLAINGIALAVVTWAIVGAIMTFVVVGAHLADI